MFGLFSRYQVTVETEVTPSGCLTPVASWQIALQLPVTHRNAFPSARSGHLGAHSWNHDIENCKGIIHLIRNVKDVTGELRESIVHGFCLKGKCVSYDTIPLPHTHIHTHWKLPWHDLHTLGLPLCDLLIFLSVSFAGCLSDTESGTFEVDHSRPSDGDTRAWRDDDRSAGLRWLSL